MVMSLLKEIGEIHGKIYHPKQLFNLFGKKLEMFLFLNELFIFYENNIFLASEFVSTFIYKASFNDLCNRLIVEKHNSFFNNVSASSSSSSLLILVFIGNESIGEDLLQKLILFQSTFYITQPFHLAVCFSPLISYKNSLLKKKFLQHFPFLAMYTCNEMGSDIGPTLLMYDNILKQQQQSSKAPYAHILKFHTKSISQDYINLTDYLFAQSVESLINTPHAFFP